MTAQEARQMVQEGKAILIDVREEQELRETGTAEGAIWMPSSAIEDEPRWNAFKDSLPKDKLLILFCKLGGRAGRMTEFLCIDGFRAVCLGGFGDWKGAGLPVQSFNR